MALPRGVLLRSVLLRGGDAWKAMRDVKWVLVWVLLRRKIVIWMFIVAVGRSAHAPC